MLNEPHSAIESFFQPGKEHRDAALAYASIGIFVFPLGVHSKVPIVKKWQIQASTDTRKIKEWWPEDALYNIGIALRLSCIVVIDIDPRNGGDVSLNELEEKHGNLPVTYTINTAGGGTHYYYRVSPDFYSSFDYPKKLADGVDLLINNLVVAPPSIMDDDKVYTIEHGNPEHLTRLPIKWLDNASLEQEDRRYSEAFWSDDEQVSIPKGERNVKLTAFAGYLRRIGLSAEQIESQLNALAESVVEDYDEEIQGEITTISHSIARKQPGDIRFFREAKISVRKTVQKPVLDDMALYGPIGDYVKHVAPQVEAHPAAMMVQGLTIFGAMIGAKYHDFPAPTFYANGRIHRTNLYTLVVGSSGSGAKGDSLAHMLELFNMVDPTLTIKTGVHTGEGIIKYLADDIELPEVATIQGKKYHHVKKGGVKDRRFLNLEPEFTRTLHTSSRLGSVIKEVMRELWDEGSTGKTTSSEDLVVTGATYSVIGHITPSDLEAELPKTDLKNGFANRFIFTYAERTHMVPDPPAISEKVLHQYSTLLQMALDESQNEYDEIVSRTPDAKYLWDNEIYPKWYKPHFQSDIMSELHSRAEPIIMRMALVYAASVCAKEIEVEHLEAATALWDYHTQTVNYLFSNQIGDKDGNLLFQGLRENPAGLTRSQISNSVFKRNKSKAQIDRALSMLLDRGLIYERKEKQVGSKKSSTIYFLSPGMFEGES